MLQILVIRHSCCTLALLASIGICLPTHGGQNTESRARPEGGSDRSIGLQRAYRLAIKNSPSLAVLDQRVLQAKAARRSAWAAIKPTIGFQGTFTHYDQEITLDFDAFIPAGLGLPSMDPVVIQKRNQFGFAFSATVPLFRGPSYPAIGIARKQVTLAKQQRQRTRKEFLLQVARAYYGVLSQKEAVRALDNKVKLDQRNVNAAKARFEVGKVPRSEVLRADLVLTQDAQALRRQRNGLGAAKRELAILVGVSGTIDAVEPAEARVPTGDGRQMVREALRSRSDYLATNTAIEAARQARRAVWWTFAPTLDGSFLYRWQETAGFANSRDSWNLMLTLTLPLYDGGLRYAQLQETRAKIMASEAERRSLAQQIEREIVRLRAELSSADAGLIAARKAVTLAHTTADDMTARYEAGTTTQLEVLDASQRQLEAELELTRSRFVRELARLALAHATGRFNPLGGK